MTIQRARRAAATVLLSAGVLFLVPGVAHADTCMTDDKGHQVCGASGTGPASGPGSYSGVSGVNNGTPGAIGPDGQPMTSATPPPWSAPGWSPPPVPANAQPAPNSPGILNAPPPGAVLPGDVKTGEVPPAQAGTVELPPPVAAGSAGGSTVGGGTPSGSPSASATTAPSATASGTPTPAPTMTAMATHAPPPTKTAEPGPVAESRASETEPFNPVPLLAGLGGLAIVGCAWFIPGIRSAITGLLSRGH